MDPLTLRRMLDERSEASFRRIYDEYTPRLLRFVCRLLGSAGGSVAEDTVQETWVRAMNRIDSFDGQSQFGTWLHGVARNVCRETLRRPDSRHLAFTADAGDGRVPDHEARLDLERAIHRLPEGQRFVLVLHDLEGYRHAEIAEQLDISVGTSKSQLHDARKNLVTMLDGGVR
jgi:RNA polymerase sigma-70 factor (ECF subfamily)